MLPKNLLLLTGMVMLNAVVSQAQTFAQYTPQTLTYRSDILPKSTLISNVAPDQSGAVSPIIGSAFWLDSGKLLQCQSYLRFSYLVVPRFLVEDPSRITLAELILSPVEMENSPADKEKISRFIVRRVVQPWNDTATMWNNQPQADSVYQVKWTLKKKQKNKLVSVDVTGMVMDMIRYENYGFMLSHDTAGKTPSSRWQWFASPLYEDETRRPLLVIHYKEPITTGILSGTVLTQEPELIRQANAQTNGTKTDVKPEPVNTPPASGGTKEQ
jgi:hypothetical protein